MTDSRMSMLIDRRYKILKKLGAGAMGEVYKVLDAKDNQIRALKILSKEKTTSEAVQRFKREFKLLTELHHPNLCDVYDFGMLKDGRSYFTMEYIDGQNIFKATKNLSRKQIYALIVQLCRALEYIHAKGLIHYDIKPTNILIEAVQGRKGESETKVPILRGTDTPFLNVKLLDFGLAGEQQLKGGMWIRGTFPYIAPEVIKGLAIDQRTDLYSLGVLLYGIFTRQPFPVSDKKSFVSLLNKKTNWASVRVANMFRGLPKELVKMIIDLLSPEPSDRPDRANEVIQKISKISGISFELETEKTAEAYILSSRFVGRDAEMKLLKSYYDKCQQGDGKIVLITGDAGIGKSRLLKEFRIFAQLKRSYCFNGYVRHDKTMPLEPFRGVFQGMVNYLSDTSSLLKPNEFQTALTVLYKIFPDLTSGRLPKHLARLAPLEPNQEKLRNLESLSLLIKSVASVLGGLVLLLEDLHWADDLSFELLEYLGRNLESNNIFLLGTARKKVVEESKIFQKMAVTLQKAGRFHRIELGPLGARSLSSFLDSTITPLSNSAELVKYLLNRTGGNPYFVEEIMRTLLMKKRIGIGEQIEIKAFRALSLPETIHDIVSTRLSDIGKNSVLVVKFAAVILSDFDYSLMKRLTTFEDTILSKVLWELTRKQILVEDGNRYRFYHATLREAVTNRLGEMERSELNEQVGRVLERTKRGNLEQVVEDLAHYFISARERKKGIKYGLKAAKKSSQRYAHEQAMHFYKGILKLLGERDSRLRADVLQKLAYTAFVTGNYDDSIRYNLQLINIKRVPLDMRIISYSRICNAHETKGDYDQAVKMLEKVQRMIGALRPGKSKTILKSTIDLHLRNLRMKLGDNGDAEKHFNAILDGLKGLRGKGITRLKAPLYNILGLISHARGDHHRSILYHQRACRYWRIVDDQNGIAGVYVNVGGNYLSTGDFKSANENFRNAIKIARRIGNQSVLINALYNQGVLFCESGHCQEGLSNFHEAYTCAKKIGDSDTLVLSLLGIGETFLMLCDYRKAMAHTQEALRICEGGSSPAKRLFTISLLGSIYKATGNYRAALGSCSTALKLAQQLGIMMKVAELLLDSGAVHLALGNIRIAQRNMKKAYQIAANLNAIDLQARVIINLCRLSLIEQDYDASRHYYGQARSASRKSCVKMRILELMILNAELLGHEGKHHASVATADKAVRLALVTQARDIYVQGLLIKVHHGNLAGLSRAQIVQAIDDACKVGQEIGSPELIWKTYFEQGRFCQNDRQYESALEYYQKCTQIFDDICGMLRNDKYAKKYLMRSDRQAVFNAIDEIERLIQK